MTLLTYLRAENSPPPHNNLAPPLWGASKYFKSYKELVGVFTNGILALCARYACAIYTRRCKQQPETMAYAQTLYTITIWLTLIFAIDIKCFHLLYCYTTCSVDVPALSPFLSGAYDTKKETVTAFEKSVTALKGRSGNNFFCSKSPIFIVYSLSLYIYILLCSFKYIYITCMRVVSIFTPPKSVKLSYIPSRTIKDQTAVTAEHGFFCQIGVFVRDCLCFYFRHHVCCKCATPIL